MEARRLDYVMPDVQRIGGVTGWMRASASPKPREWRCRATCSRSTAPSAGGHADLPLAGIRRLGRAVVAEPIQIRDGRALIPARPGSGITWNEAA